METVAIRVLGPISADVDGRAVDLGGPQRRAVLACLVMERGSVVSPSVLIDRLWPEDPPESATKLIQKHISGLRGALGREAIETTGGGYRLVVPDDHIDAARFEAALADGRPLAVDWLGEPYAGCGELPFVLAERARLGRVRLEADLDRLSVDLDRHDFGPALAQLERLANEHPQHERVAALLMRGLYNSDRHVDALRAFRRHETHLRDELGVDPSPELVRLEARILRHDEALRTRPADPPASSPADVPTDAGAPVGEEEVRTVSVVVVSAPVVATAPDDLRTTQRSASDAVAQVVARHDGHLQPTDGGEVIAVVGVPARDDDRVRAVALARELGRLHPECSVAVASGDAIVSPAPVRLLAGALLGVARRLAARGAPGELVIDGSVELADDEVIDTPLVGRDDEIRRIAEVWERVTTDGRLRIAELVGEAGIGKTHLARDAISRLEPAPHHVIELGLSSFGDGTFLGSLRTSLERLGDGALDLEGMLGGLGVLPSDVVSRLAAQLRPLVDSSDATRADAPDQWLAPMIELIDALATIGPLVIAVEDLHWATPHLGGRIADGIAVLTERPVLVVVSRRPEPPFTEFDGIGVAERLQLQVGPLGPEAGRLVASAVTGSVDPAAVDRVIERSGGNPLFLQQCLRLLQDRPDDAETDVPGSVRSVVAIRLDHLEPGHRSLLQSAALVPRRITTSTMATMLDRPEADVAAALANLVRRGLLRRIPAQPGRPVRHEFQHVLVAEAAYAQLTRNRRITLHQRAAELIEPASIDDVVDIAHHWQQVVRLASAEASPLDAATATTARTVLASVGDRLHQLDARQSVGLAHDALSLAEDGSDEQATLLLKLGELCTDTGDFERATAALAEAADVYDRLGNSAGAGEALARQARAQWYVGDGDAIDALLTESAGRLVDAPPSREQAHALVVLAIQTAIRGRSADAIEIADRAEDVVQAHGSTEDLIRWLHARGQARYDLDDPGGVEDLERALTTSLEHGLGRLSSQSYNNLAEVLWVVRGPREALPLAEAGLGVATERGYLAQVPWHIAQIAELRFDLGHWDELVADLDHPIERTPALAWRDTLAARVSFWRGDDAAAEAVSAGLSIARSTGELQLLVPMLSASIAAAAAVGDATTAVELGTELVEVAGGQRQHSLRDAGDAARGLCRIGRDDLLRELLPDAAAVIPRRRLMWETARGALAEAEGRFDEAIEHHQRAEAGWRSFPHGLEAAHAAAAIARLAHRSAGLEDSAVAAEHRAVDGFTRLGAVRCIDELHADRVDE